MHPLSNFNFGNTAPSIGVLFNNGSSVVGGYIVKQLGTRKFKVTADGVNIFIATLAQINTSPASGEMTIEVYPFANGAVSGTPEHARAITANIVDTIEGNRYQWTYDATISGEAQIAQYSPAPVAQSFTANAAENANTMINLAAHVTGTTESYVITANSGNATVSVNNAGLAEYTPVANFVGMTTFAYMAVGELSNSNVANVTVTVS